MRSVEAIALVALVACGGAAPTTTVAPVAVVSTAIAPSAPPSTSASAIGSASASTSAAPSDPCFDAPPTGAVGYDAASDRITICGGKGACIAFGKDGSATNAVPPTVAGTDLVAPTLTVPREPTPLVRVGGRLVVDGDPKRWIAMPGNDVGQVLWTSKDGTRAMLWRSVPSTTSAQREKLDLVDLAKHVVVAHTEGCAYFAGADSARTDANESFLLMDFGMANPVLTYALFDLKNARFVALSSATNKLPAGNVCGDDVVGSSFETDFGFGTLVDATHRRTHDALYTLDGKRVATLVGDFPRPPPHPATDQREVVIDDATHVVVVTTSIRVCTGVMHLLASTAPPTEPPPPRCVRKCGAATNLQDAWD